jgi:hypothetical protein
MPIRTPNISLQSMTRLCTAFLDADQERIGGVARGRFDGNGARSRWSIAFWDRLSERRYDSLASGREYIPSIAQHRLFLRRLVK